MQVLTRAAADPFALSQAGKKSAAIKKIDLERAGQLYWAL
jgi:hypothetical protein